MGCHFQNYRLLPSRSICNHRGTHNNVSSPQDLSSLQHIEISWEKQRKASWNGFLFTAVQSMLNFSKMSFFLTAFNLILKTLDENNLEIQEDTDSLLMILNLNVVSCHRQLFFLQQSRNHWSHSKPAAGFLICQWVSSKLSSQLWRPLYEGDSQNFICRPCLAKIITCISRYPDGVVPSGLLWMKVTYFVMMWLTCTVFEHLPAVWGVLVVLSKCKCVVIGQKVVAVSSEKC